MLRREYLPADQRRKFIPVDGNLGQIVTGAGLDYNIR
jgi:hypothetical protein